MSKVICKSPFSILVSIMSRFLKLRFLQIDTEVMNAYLAEQYEAGYKGPVELCQGSTL